MSSENPSRRATQRGPTGAVAAPASPRSSGKRDAAPRQDDAVAGDDGEEVRWERLELLHAYEAGFDPYEQLGHLVDRFEKKVTRSPDHTRTGRGKLPRFDVVVAKVLTGVALAAYRADRQGLRVAYRWADGYVDANRAEAPSLPGGTAWPPAESLAECLAILGSPLPTRRRIYERLLRSATLGLGRFEGRSRNALQRPKEHVAICKDAEIVGRSLGRVASAAGLPVPSRGVEKVRNGILEMLTRVKGPAWFRTDGPEMLVRIALVGFEVVANRNAARDWCKGATSGSTA